MIRGAAYCSLVFSVGFILGVIRTVWVVPRVGERLAELIEAPLMLVAIYCAARFVTQRFEASRAVDYLYSGVVALVLMLAVEFSIVLALQGMSIAEYWAERDADGPALPATIGKATGMKIAVELELVLKGQVDLTWNTADWREGLTVALSQIGPTWDDTPTHIIVME